MRLRKNINTTKPDKDSQMQEKDNTIKNEFMEANTILNYLNIGYFSITDNMITLSEKSQNILSFKDKSVHIDNLLSQINTDDKGQLEDLIKNPKKNKKRTEIQFRYQPSNELKEPKIIKIIFDPLLNTEDNKTTGIIQDITRENRQMKELVKSKERAEEADKMKTMFLANISHQIRTPMNSIIGFSELMSLSDASHEIKKEYLEIIKQQSTHLLRLIDDIGEMVKYEAGKLTVTKSACDLNLLLNDVRIYFSKQNTLRSKTDIFINIKNNDDNIVILTDAGRLLQVFTYLINNAIKYTEAGKIELGYSIEEDQKIQFYVKDSSPGLSKEEQRNLFDLLPSSFAQPTEYDDINIGLKISKEIVKLLGGKIWVESEPGKGTIIYFNIPKEDITQQEPVEYGSDEHGGYHYLWKDKVILVVEDEEVNAMFLEAIFQDTEAQVIYAKNGQQAVDLCKSINKIDIILMDIKMPIMNGIKATTEIRKFNTNIPIIAQTALASPEDKEQCMLAGCNDTIIKPIEVEELMGLISRYLGE
jgi:signal transduction histidine kinase/CheY-like chemotaxis protein